MKQLTNEELRQILSPFKGEQRIWVQHPESKRIIALGEVTIVDGQIVLNCFDAGVLEGMVNPCKEVVLSHEEKPFASDRATIYADGGCYINPGPGSWACLIRSGLDHVVRAAGFVPQTITNQKAEIIAVTEGIRRAVLGGMKKATVWSDSEYVIKTMTGKFQRGANQEYWTRLSKIISENELAIDWKWVKGGSHPDQLDCDTRAKQILKDNC